jgi:hypothetical protein
MYDGPYNRKTLPLVWRVVALSLVILGCIRDNIFLAFSSSWPRITPILIAFQLVCRLKTLLKSGLLKWGTLKAFPWVC